MVLFEWRISLGLNWFFSVETASQSKKCEKRQFQSCDRVEVLSKDEREYTQVGER